MWRMARTDGGYFRLLFPLELAAPLPGRGLAIQRCFRALYACQIRKTLVGVLTWTNRQSVGAAWRWRGGLRPCSAPGLSNKGPLKAKTTHPLFRRPPRDMLAQARRSRLLLGLVGVLVRLAAHIQAHRRARHVEIVAQPVDQIARIAFRQLVGMAAHHHETGGPCLGLRHVAQLDPG